MNKNGKVFANKINKYINNNESIYYSKNEKEDIKVTKTNVKQKNIYQKINEIFNSRDYIYKADVIIYTKNGELKKRIIGRNSKHLITTDNELIPIADIIDIKKQEKKA